MRPLHESMAREKTEGIQVFLIRHISRAKVSI